MPNPAPDAGRARGLDVVLAALLLLHLLLGLVRVPFKVLGQRCRDVADYERRGAPAFFLGGPHQFGAEVVDWILENVPPDQSVLFRGDSKGSLEFLPGMIAPRLLVMEISCQPGVDSYHGRKLATRRGAGGEREVVVVAALGNELRLEAR